MKRVSSEVAKYLKEVGYPQGICYNLLYEVDEPTYLEVQFWLWREKDIRIVPGNLTCFIWQDTEYTVIETAYSDPEEVIAAAIEYLVDND